MQNKEMPPWLFITLIAVPLVWIIGAPILLWRLPQEPIPDTTLLYWIITIIALTVFMIAVGYRLKKKILGVLIDERNKMTLSRLQLIVWTVIVISGYATAALWNLFAAEASDPLAVQLPEELWWLLGISTVSLVGSPLVLQAKKQQVPNTAQQATYVEQKLSDQQQGLGDQQQAGPAQDQVVPNIPNVGNVAINPTPQQASLADMFKGDEIGNELSVDISKIQMFFFTIVVVLAYGTVLGELFLTPTGAIGAFPGLSEGILVLLGISHAGYLGYKGVSHSAPAAGPQVPNVVGMDLQVAGRMIEGAGLRHVDELVQNESAAGTVLWTNPAPATTLAAGAMVTLYYSSGQPQ